MLRLNQAATQKFSIAIPLLLILILAIGLAKISVTSTLPTLISLYVLFVGACILIFAFHNIELFLLFLFATRSIIDNFWFIPIFSLGSKNINLLMVWGVATPCFAVLLLVVNRVNVMSHSIARPMLLSVFINIIAVIVSPFKLEALGYFFRIVGCYPFFFLAGIFSTNRRQINNLLKSYLISVLVVAILSIYQLAGGIEYHNFTGNFGRVTGLYNDTGTVSFYIMLAIPALLFLISQSSGSSKIVYSLFIGLLIIILFFTYHRASWIVVAVQLILWSFMTKKLHYSVVSISIFLCTLVLLHGSITSFLSGFYEPLTIVYTPSGGFSDTALSGRIGIWRAMTSYFMESSYILKFLGNGLDTTTYIARIYIPGRFRNLVPTGIHSDYLRILIENGIAGLLVHSWLLGILIKNTLVSSMKEKDIYFRCLSQAFLLCLIFFILMGITTMPSEYPSFNWYFFALAGIVFHRQKEWQDKI